MSRDHQLKHCEIRITTMVILMMSMVVVGNTKELPYPNSSSMGRLLDGNNLTLEQTTTKNSISH